MRNDITLDDIKKIYAIIQQDIERNNEKDNIDRVYQLIDTYSVLVQTINDHFRDDFIENILKSIASRFLNSQDDYNSKDENIIVFYDQIGTTICLGLQYLRALKQLGYRVVYIFESPSRKVKKDLLLEVYSSCEAVYVFQEKSTISLARKIREIIISSKACKLISHCSAEGALGATVFYSLNGLEKYRIVPGDHHFNIGIDSYDHFFDYRNFAIKVSIEERKIPMKKVHKLPYYPIIENNMEFAGFPAEAQNKTVILAAGSEYKFHGSTWFYDFSKKLLFDNPNTVIVFLGGKSPHIVDYVKSQGLEHRFLLLGYRKDFVACMKHSDIFLNSYPMGGGLVGLTAVNLGIPVLSHYDEYNALQNSIRSFMGAEDVDSPISFIDDSKMHEYANSLIRDVLYRRSEGARMKKMAQTKQNFDRILGEILKEDKHVVKSVTEKSCHLEKRLENYIQLQNTFLPSVLNLLIKEYGLGMFRKFWFLKGFIIKNKKIVLGWLLGMYCKKMLPEKEQEVLKKKLRKYFE